MFGLSVDNWKKMNGFNTAKEIYQQPEIWSECLATIEKQKTIIEKFINENLNKNNIRVIFSGAGTSAYIGDIITPELNSKKNYIFESIPTTDIVANPQDYLKKDIPTLLVSFARSGNSPESIAAYDLANVLIDDVNHIIITCNEEGELINISKNDEKVLHLIMPEESNDKGFAMTSSFSCMTLVASLIFDMECFEKNKTQIFKMIDLGRDILENKYMNVDQLLDIDFERVVYLGSGSLYGLSKESGLKLLELTRGKVITLSETPLGFRHGPKSMLNDRTLVFIYISDDEYSRKYELDLLNELYNDKGAHRVISIASKYREEIEIASDYNFYLTDDENDIKNKSLLSLLYILYAQIFALKSSVKLKVEPDNPNPYGLVNRVVKGVTIYNYKGE